MRDAAGGVRSADHAPIARHVGVAAFRVKNRPETGKRSMRWFHTAAGWFFAPALPLGLPRCAGRTGPHAEEHRTRSRVYPRSGASKGARRARTAAGTTSAVLRCVSKHEGQHRVSVPSHDVKQPRSSRSRGACLRPGFASLLHSPRIEGWAERRETFGCNGTRGAYHDAIRQAPSEAPCVPWRGEPLSEIP